MFDPSMPEFNWQTLCKRTNDPKLKAIEAILDSMAIPHRRNGESWHAPILEVPDGDHERAYEEILMSPDSVYGIFDERPDDDPMFDEYLED